MSAILGIAIAIYGALALIAIIVAAFCLCPRCGKLCGSETEACAEERK